MEFLKRIFRFYIESSIHVSLAICCLAGVSLLLYEIPFDIKRFLFLFTASVTGYNFAKYAGAAGFHHKSLTRQLKSIQVFSLFCFVTLIVLTFMQSANFIIITAVLGVFTFFYTLPFDNKGKGLRSLKGLKIFVIAVVWAGATLWLPLTDYIELWTFEIGLRSLSYFALVLALILPFEIRDLQFDQPELGTFPQRFGVKNTKRIGYVFLLIFVGLTFMIYAGQAAFTINIFIAVLVGFLIWKSKINQSRYYASFWVESIPILWFLLLLAFL